MQRNVTAHLELEIRGRTNMIFSVAVAQNNLLGSESLNFVLDGVPVASKEIIDRHGTRLHQVIATPGAMVVDYSAEIIGTSLPIYSEEIDQISYLRQSRYCESDVLTPTARAQFASLTGHELLAAVSSWVGSQLRYLRGSSRSTDGAVHTLLLRAGVCRDFAHVAIALLRALGIPARMVSVYAPGLTPMDFHAVCEAYLEGSWHLIDATGLAPRQSLVRIATGRDAADVAFLTNHWADLILRKLTVTAIVDELPVDDTLQLVTMG